MNVYIKIIRMDKTLSEYALNGQTPIIKYVCLIHLVKYSLSLHSIYITFWPFCIPYVIVDDIIFEIATNPN